MLFDHKGMKFEIINSGKLEKIHKCVEINTFLKNQWVKEEITRKIKNLY